MECGNCTECCKLLQIPETDSKPCIYCQYCTPNVGCNIYKERPECCKIFECCWKQMKVVAEELRPDRCGMMFEKWSDKVIVGATDKITIDKIALRQIHNFNKEGISILVINHKAVF